jgi:MFS family permease
LRRRLLTVRGTLGSFLASLLALVLIPAVVAALLPLLRFVGGGRPVEISRGDVYFSGIYALGFLAATLALAIALCGFAGRRAGARNLTVGALVPWLVLCVLSAALMPRVSYVFTWPLLLALIGLAASIFLPDARSGSKASYVRPAILVLFGAAAIALLAPLIYLLHLALTVSLAAVTAAFVVLGVGLLAGPVALVGGEGVRVSVWASLGLAFAAAGLFVAGGQLSGFDTDHPRPDSILYGLDADSGEAVWATYDETDDYTSRFFGPNSERGALEDFLPSGPPGLLGEAPAVPLAAPAVEVLGDEKNGDTRTIRLRVSSPRGAKNLSLWVESDDLQNSDTLVLSTAVDGRPVGETAKTGWWGKWGVEFYNLPEDGVEMTLEVRAGAPLRLRAVDYSDGLPDVPGIEETRPADTMPRYDEQIRNAAFADATFVGKSFDLTQRS